MSRPHFPHNDKNPLLTTRETARHLGVSLRTIQLWVEDGKLLAGKTPGGHRRIRYSAMQALAANCGISVPEPDTIQRHTKPAPKMLAVATMAVHGGERGAQFDVLAAGERMAPGNYVLHVIHSSAIHAAGQDGILGSRAVADLRDREMQAYRDGIYSSPGATEHRLQALIREVEKRTLAAERRRVADSEISD